MKTWEREDNLRKNQRIKDRKKKSQSSSLVHFVALKEAFRAKWTENEKWAVFLVMLVEVISQRPLRPLMNQSTFIANGLTLVKKQTRIPLASEEAFGVPLAFEVCLRSEDCF